MNIRFSKGLFLLFSPLKVTYHSFVSRNIQGKWKSWFYYIRRNPSQRVYFWPESDDNFLLNTVGGKHRVRGACGQQAGRPEHPISPLPIMGGCKTAHRTLSQQEGLAWRPETSGVNSNNIKAVKHEKQAKSRAGRKREKKDSRIQLQ